LTSLRTFHGQGPQFVTIRRCGNAFQKGVRSSGMNSSLERRSPVVRRVRPSAAKHRRHARITNRSGKSGLAAEPLHERHERAAALGNAFIHDAPCTYRKSDLGCPATSMIGPCQVETEVSFGIKVYPALRHDTEQFSIPALVWIGVIALFGFTALVPDSQNQTSICGLRRVRRHRRLSGGSPAGPETISGSLGSNFPRPIARISKARQVTLVTRSNSFSRRLLRLAV